MKTIMNNMKRATVMTVLGSVLLAGSSAGAAAAEADLSYGADNFYISEAVNTETVKFNNLLGIEITGTLFTPKQMDSAKKYPALIVGHPFGAVRQQAANLYATKMAEAGFVTLSFDQVFWGESGGSPRGTVLPDLYVESFNAGVDFMGTRPFIDREKIGVIGVCASGAFAIAAAKIDPRIKAVATVSMYDMGEYFRTGVNHDRAAATLKNDLQIAAEQRYATFESGDPVYGPGQNDPVYVEAPESNAFYRTERGMVPSNDRRSTPASYAKFLNFYPFSGMESISPRPILFVVGDNAPSRCYTDTAYEMAAAPKELVVVKGANRTDLYDRSQMIPFDKLASFFNLYLNR